jgi:hypothetical protein
MSDEPARLAEGMTVVSRERARIENHVCERDGCAKSAPFGFARRRQQSHWFCLEHRADGDRYL